MNPVWYFDEVDLSTSFDDSMNGIGADFVNSMFNMRDALSALPACEEPLLPGDIKLECNSGAPIQVQRSETQPSGSHSFETTLRASTSSATRYTEDPLTYLNQDQTYELVMVCSVPAITKIKSLIKVRFHDYQMELKEQEHLENWRKAHPGERMLDVDLTRSCGYEDLTVDECNPNTIICLWNAEECTVGLRVHCLGTEFTERKHGGEKGVSFRIQVDYLNVETGCPLETCACQVKVFRMKGADRKHRTDREKLERKSREGRSVYKPSIPVTKLLPLPTRRVKSQTANTMPPSSINPLSPSIDQNIFGQLSHVDPGVPNSPVAVTVTPNSSGSAEFHCRGTKTICSPTTPHYTTSTHLGSCPKVGVLVRSDNGTQFTVPGQVLSCRARRSSPGPHLSPSPSRHLPGTNTVSAMHRRRRQRGLDACTGSCSSCGRSCRNPNSRWVKTNKTRACCPHWDTPGSRSKQPSWLSEKRRASCSYERSSAVSIPVRLTQVAPVEAEKEIPTGPKVRELSTSAESSFGNDELSKWTLIDAQDDETPASSSAVQSRLNSAQTTASTPVDAPTTMCGHTSPTVDMCSSDVRCSPSPPCSPETRGDAVARSQEKGTLDRAPEPIEHSPSSQIHCEEGLSVEVAAVPVPGDVPQSASASTVPRIHAGMSAAEVVEWFRASNFGNLVEKFQTFTGRDMLRLTKEDFLSLCGAVEGLRLHNAFYNKPPRPRCTLYVSRKEKAVYQALMLYELTRDELLRQVAPVISLRTDQINTMCVYTGHSIPVLLTNELVSQLDDHSCYHIEIGWNAQRKANVFLRPV
ncbi:Transcription factor CP2 [Fasciola hepatica]|uniref:Transcription factor CP2 n=1 Tax=Fasciola hepatica TaxID=6192 RepID=A0A4E0RY90_FASHE|nr:Transcription factor CP2 [Fasciola hepatica]